MSMVNPAKICPVRKNTQIARTFSDRTALHTLCVRPPRSGKGKAAWGFPHAAFFKLKDSD